MCISKIRKRSKKKKNKRRNSNNRKTSKNFRDADNEMQLFFFNEFQVGKVKSLHPFTRTNAYPKKKKMK